MNQYSIKEAIYDAVNRLSDSDTAKLDCEILLSSVINQNREYLFTHPEQVLDASVYADFNSMVQKRADGFPVAYLTGSREFWTVNISVNRYTLIPRPETECLVDAALQLIGPDGDHLVLELGTGSGAISIALGKARPLTKITATEICENALGMAISNASDNGVNNISFVHSDWFSGLGQEKFDFIVSNPPYVESDCPEFTYGDIRHEPRLALDGGKSGLDAFIRIIPAAVHHLRTGGTILLEHGFSQGEKVRRLLMLNGFTDIRTIIDLSGHERVTVARIKS